MLINFLTNKQINEARSSNKLAQLEQLISYSTIYSEKALRSELKNKGWLTKIDRRLQYWLEQTDPSTPYELCVSLFFDDYNKFKSNVTISDYPSITLHNLIFCLNIDSSYFPFTPDISEYTNPLGINIMTDLFDLHIDLSECADDIEVCLKNISGNRKAAISYIDSFHKGDAILNPIIVKAFLEQFDFNAFYKKVTEIIDSIFLNYLDN